LIVVVVESSDCCGILIFWFVRNVQGTFNWDAQGMRLNVTDLWQFFTYLYGLIGGIEGGGDGEVYTSL